jgi:hypothetical protein
MVEFKRFACPVCGYLRDDHSASCPECHWGEARPAPVRRFQFTLPALFDFLIVAALISFAARIFLAMVAKIGMAPSVAILVLAGLCLFPFIALYRWWSTDNF